jgi:hypothetical protein
MNFLTIPWLMLVASLPTASATARMRLWRAIKSMGCVPLRDGAYLLPASAVHASALEELAIQTNAEGGQAWVVDVTTRSQDDATAFEALFDRAAEYATFTERLHQARKQLTSQSAADIGRLVKRLRKDLDALERTDFFPGDAALDAQAAWLDFQDAAQAVLCPDEPRATAKTIVRLDAADYRGRLWATRRNLWADRVACAWLIRRFIDPDARFMWLTMPSQCPEDALGFDFDGAAFTHVEDKVSFEVLLASFGLDQDAGLVRLGAMVHALDMGDAVSTEAAGFAAILSGASTRLQDDDALLAEMGGVLDSLLIYFRQEKKS